MGLCSASAFRQRYLREISNMRAIRVVNFVLLFIFAGTAMATESRPSDSTWLKVSGDKIVNQQGQPVYLRGFGLGGMLHMENFIDGYAGNEQSVREGLLKVLGKKRYDLFFNEFYKNY